MGFFFSFQRQNGVNLIPPSALIQGWGEYQIYEYEYKYEYL